MDNRNKDARASQRRFAGDCSLLGVGILVALLPACTTSAGDPVHLGEATSELMDVFVDRIAKGGFVCGDGSAGQAVIFHYGGRCTITNTLPNSSMTVTGPGFDQTSTTGSIVLIDVPASDQNRYSISVSSSTPPPDDDCVPVTMTAQCEDPIAFWMNFFSDGDPGQCNGAATGLVRGGLNEWTPFVRIDTDNRPGGCRQQFGITDPASLLNGLMLSVNFDRTPGADGQCEDVGLRPVPVSHSTSPTLSQSYRIDTDNRAGGCDQTFSLAGRTDIELEVEFFGDGDGGQCPQILASDTRVENVTFTHSVTRRIDADGRPGGCQQRFRLHRPGR